MPRTHVGLSRCPDGLRPCAVLRDHIYIVVSASPQVLSRASSSRSVSVVSFKAVYTVEIALLAARRRRPRPTPGPPLGPAPRTFWATGPGQSLQRVRWASPAQLEVVCRARVTRENGTAPTRRAFTRDQPNTTRPRVQGCAVFDVQEHEQVRLYYTRPTMNAQNGQRCRVSRKKSKKCTHV